LTFFCPDYFSENYAKIPLFGADEAGVVPTGCRVEHFATAKCSSAANEVVFFA